MFCKNKTNIAKRKKTISKHPFFFFFSIPLPYLYPLSFPFSSILSILSIYSIISIPLYLIYPSSRKKQEEGQSIRT